MSKRFTFFFLFVCIASEIIAQVPASERAALQAFYTSLNGDNWVSQTDADPANDWDFTGPVTSNWFGVTVSGGHVTRIFMNPNGTNNLSGNLPDEIGDLVELQELIINDEGVTGAIPTSIGNLQNLTILRFGGCSLGGNLPIEISNLTNLEFLSFFNNNLDGTIPTQLSACTNLTTLDLRVNNFTGTIPDFFNNFPNLEFALFAQNQLSGSIPESLGTCTNLVNIGLGSNQLTGSIPTSIQNCTMLGSLTLGQNQLSGEIPDFFNNFPDLGQLYLQNNQFTGNLPQSIASLSNLRQLLVDNNQLTGEVPVEYGNLSALRDFVVDNNQLSGVLPATLSNLNLSVFLIDNNQFTGTIPDLSGSPDLRAVWIEDNQFHFGDFENQFAAFAATNNFNYSPQAFVNETETISAGCGESTDATLTTDVRGSANIYQWYRGVFPNGTIINGANSAEYIIDPVTPADEGEYYCIITSTLVPGLELVRNPITVVNDQGEAVTAHPINAITACDADGDGSADFEIDIVAIEEQVLNGQAGLTVQFFDALGNEVSLTNPFTSIAQTLTVEVSNSAGCSDETTLELELSTTEPVDELEDVEACLNYVLPELSNGSYYTETGGAGMTIDPGTEITESQTLYIFSGTGDCAAESSFEVVINEGEEEEITVPPLCTGDTFELPDGREVTESGRYELLFPDECRTEVYQVTIEPCDCTPQFPTAFIPNGNGINERFTLLNSGVCSIQTRRMTIYNRWGEAVFESATTNPEWNGGDEPQGLYLWVIEYVIDTNEEVQKESGSLYLLGK